MVIGESVPGIFRSSIQRVREGTESIRVTVPDGVARLLGAEPEGTLLWSVDLKAGEVRVSAEPPSVTKRKSSKRD
jgi:hypothetical protein